MPVRQELRRVLGADTICFTGSGKLLFSRDYASAEFFGEVILLDLGFFLLGYMISSATFFLLRLSFAIFLPL